MPRDLNGNYILPSGNPVAGGTIIESDWANDTMGDLASEMQDSLSRSGNGGLLAPLKFDSGTAAVPSITWNLDTTTGRYLFGNSDQRDTVGGQDVVRYRLNGIDVVQESTFTLTPTIIEAAPTLPEHATRKDYVDALVAAVPDDYVSSVTDTDVSANTEWQDGFGIQFGDDGDCRIVHNGTDTEIDINSGLLTIAAKFTFDPAGSFIVTGNIEATGGIDHITDQNGGGALKTWTGTQAEYDALTPDPATLYYIEET